MQYHFTHGEKRLCWQHHLCFHVLVSLCSDSSMKCVYCTPSSHSCCSSHFSECYMFSNICRNDWAQRKFIFSWMVNVYFIVVCSFSFQLKTHEENVDIPSSPSLHLLHLLHSISQTRVYHQTLSWETWLFLEAQMTLAFPTRGSLVLYMEVTM